MSDPLPRIFVAMSYFHSKLEDTTSKDHPSICRGFNQSECTADQTTKLSLDSMTIHFSQNFEETFEVTIFSVRF